MVIPLESDCVVKAVAILSFQLLILGQPRRGRFLENAGQCPLGFIDPGVHRRVLDAGKGVGSKCPNS